MPLLLVLLFIIVPLAEVWLIVRVAGMAGWGVTVLGLFAVSVAGAVLVKREGTKAWAAFTSALAQARIPAKEVVDGALVLVGGALMLTPGFLTDAVGLLCVLPFSRALVNKALRARVRGMFVPPGVTSAVRGWRAASQSPDDVIDVEVVDVKRDDDPPRLDAD